MTSSSPTTQAVSSGVSRDGLRRVDRVGQWQSAADRAQFVGQLLLRQEQSAEHGLRYRAGQQ